MGKLDAIEAEMRRLGVWSPLPLAPEKLNFREPFAMDTMTFTEWLQFVFMPRARAAAESGQFPKGWGMATMAAREFDGMPEFERLADLLSDFEAWVNAGAPA
jgi:uncharacterized protein YqcC (DUF446 family)